MSKSFWYVLPGVNPVPWTSPSVAVIRVKGKPVPKVYSATELKNYKQAVADAVDEHYPERDDIIEDEIALRFFFWRKVETLDRGKGKGRSKKANYADATNLQKSTEDALQGVLFKNDRQVVHAESWVMAQHDEVKPLIVVELVWHPDRPDLPEAVQARVDDHPTLGDAEDDNVHDVPVEDYI